MSYGAEYIAGSWYGEGNRLANVAITVPEDLGTTMLLALVTGRSTSSNPDFITGFTWQGDGFTAIPGGGSHAQYDGDGEGEVYAWYLLNPTIAGPANVSMAYNSNNNHDTLCSILLLKNVELEAPVGWAFAVGGGVTTKTNSGIVTVEGNLLFQLGGLYSTVSSPNFGAGQSLGDHEAFASTQTSSQIWSHKRAGSASESMQTNWTTARDVGFGAFSVAVKRETAQQIIVAL